MKRCKFCHRPGTRLVECRTRFGHPDGWRCRNPVACIKRQERLDQWEGKRVLRRSDSDGTEWTIRRLPGSALYTLTCEYRQHRAMTTHSTIESAKSHRDDLVRSWEARTMREYAGGRP